MWIHISRCGSTFPNVDPHLEIWIHIRCDTYLSPVVVASCNHTYWAVKPRHSRTGAPGPGLRASPGLTRYSYPQAFHVLRFPGQAGSQLLGSQFDLHRCSNSSTGEGGREPQPNARNATHCAIGVSLSCCSSHRGPRKPTRCLPGRFQPKNCTPSQNKAFTSSGQHRPNKNVPLRHRWPSFRGGDITLCTAGPLCNLGSATTINTRHAQEIQRGEAPDQQTTWHGTW